MFRHRIVYQGFEIDFHVIYFGISHNTLVKLDGCEDIIRGVCEKFIQLVQNLISKQPSHTFALLGIQVLLLPF